MNGLWQPTWQRDYGGACYEPTTATLLAAASIAATVAGAGVAYMGAQNAAEASSQQANYNAQIAANNKIQADQAAEVAKQQGDIDQVKKAQQESVLIGQQKAGLAANGVDVGSGSAVDLLADTKAAGMLDQLTIANNTARTVAGYKNQGIGYQNQAALDRSTSANALTAGNLAGAGSLITAAGKVASTWYNFNYGTKQSNSSLGAN